VVAIRPCRRQFEVPFLAQRFIEKKDFFEQRDQPAAIEEQMVKCQREDVFGRFDVDQRQADQGWNTQLKSAASLGLQIGVQPAFLLAMGQTAPVLVFDLKPDTAMDLLAGLQAAPTETRPQNDVPFEGSFPGLTKRGDGYLLGQ